MWKEKAAGGVKNLDEDMDGRKQIDLKDEEKNQLV